MRIAILGSGLMGGKRGTIFARAGHDVVFSYARSEQKLKRLARQAGGRAQAGTPDEAVRDADAVLLAVHWSRVDDVLTQAGRLNSKVIISCSLPMNADDSELVIGRTSSGAEALAKKARRAHVVSAFATVPSEVLFNVFDKRRRATRPSLVYCGDNQKAKRRSRCSSHNLPTRGRADPRSPIDSSGSRHASPRTSDFAVQHGEPAVELLGFRRPDGDSG